VEYNHFEMLTIPKELFTKEKGRVSLQIRSVHAKDPFQEERCLLRIQVFYKVIGDTVVLSNERFE